ncbi:MAG: RcnB family protein, partial [Pseudomonadota bacterium]
QEAPRYEGQRDHWRNERRDERHFDHRDDRRYGYPGMHQNDRRFYYNAHGPEFRRGGYIPREYRSRQYYVTDYRMHHLRPPPRGQQWVQVGPDYVLIAIATGLIVHMVLSQ